MQRFPCKFRTSDDSRFGPFLYHLNYVKESESISQSVSQSVKNKQTTTTTTTTTTKKQMAELPVVTLTDNFVHTTMLFRGIKQGFVAVLRYSLRVA